jgi:hypothetical protein
VVADIAQSRGQPTAPTFKLTRKANTMDLLTPTSYEIHRAALTTMTGEAQQIITARLAQGFTLTEALRSARRPLRAAGRARVLADVSCLEDATWTG